MKHAGRWLLWSPARFMRVTACMVVVLIVWGVTGAVLFGRDTEPASKTETASSAVECRRVVSTWTSAWVAKGSSDDQWVNRVQEVTTVRGGQYLPLTDRDLIPASGAMRDATVDGDSCIAVVTIGGRPWTVTAVHRPSGWLVDSWDDGS